MRAECRNVSEIRRRRGRILQDGETEGRVIMLRPIWFQCVEFWISTGISCTYSTQSELIVCMLIADLRKIWLAQDIPKPNLCVSRGMSLRKVLRKECKAHYLIWTDYYVIRGPGYLSRYCDSLRAGRSGDRIPVGARFCAPDQTGPGAHPASCTMGTGSFLWVKAAGA